jgi:hypothetical protein
MPTKERESVVAALKANGGKLVLYFDYDTADISSQANQEIMHNDRPKGLLCIAIQKFLFVNKLNTTIFVIFTAFAEDVGADVQDSALLFCLVD